MSINGKLLPMSEEWLQYAIRLNLLTEKKEDLMELKCKVLEHDKIKSCLCDIKGFHNTLVSNHSCGECNKKFFGELGEEHGITCYKAWPVGSRYFKKNRRTG